MRKHRGWIRQALMLCAVAVAAGCHSQTTGAGAPIPDWLNQFQDDGIYIYAVGMSGKTRSARDAWNQAAQRGRAELGKTIVTRVASKDLVISTDRSEYSRQVIEALSDTELHFTEVVARWYDENGAYGPPQYYYVLVRMKRQDAEAVLRKVQ